MFLFRVEVLRFFSRALEIKGSRVVLRAISRAILRGEGEGERCRRSSSLETNLGSLNKSRVWFASFEVDAGHRPISELALRLSRWTEYTNQSASSLRVLRVGRTERSSARVDSFVDSTNQSAGFASCKSDAIFASILFSFLLADDSHLFFCLVSLSTVRGGVRRQRSGLQLAARRQTVQSAARRDLPTGAARIQVTFRPNFAPPTCHGRRCKKKQQQFSKKKKKFLLVFLFVHDRVRMNGRLSICPLWTV